MAYLLAYVYAVILFILCSDIYMSSPTDGINTEVEKLKTDGFKTTCEREIIDLRTEMKSLIARVAELEQQFASKELPKVVNNDTTTYHVVRLLNKRAVRRRRRAPEIAFQASLTKEYASFKLYDAIIFNEVITNIGNAYNKRTGIFTAPLAGTYSFYTNIVSEKGHYVEASIQVNNEATVSAISDHRISSNRNSFDIWDQGNAVAILKLRKGDKVCVSVQWPQGWHDIHGVGKSSFSGYLLRAHAS